MSKQRFIGCKADKMNARLGHLLREMGVDTRGDPYASVLGAHKYPPRIRLSGPPRIGHIHGMLDRLAEELRIYRQKREKERSIRHGK